MPDGLLAPPMVGEHTDVGMSGTSVSEIREDRQTSTGQLNPCKEKECKGYQRHDPVERYDVSQV